MITLSELYSAYEQGILTSAEFESMVEFWIDLSLERICLRH